MQTLMISVIVALALVLISLFWLIPAKIKRDRRRFILLRELHQKIAERIDDIGRALAEFLQEVENSLKILKSEKDLKFVEKTRAYIENIADREAQGLIKLPNVNDNPTQLEINLGIASRKAIISTIRNYTEELKKRVADYQKKIEEAWVCIGVAKQHLSTYTEELDVYVDRGYHLGPDRHFATSEVLIREAEKFMASDAPDPERAIAKCKEASELAKNFVFRINLWVTAHAEAKDLLERVRTLEHQVRERYKYACAELDLLQMEYPYNIWYPLDISFGENPPNKKLEELSGKRFEAMDKMDMKVQNFEGALVTLKDILEELKKLEEVVERPIKTREKLKASQEVAVS